MINKKIYALVHIIEDDGTVTESVLGVSFSYQVLKDLQSKLEPALISEAIWSQLVAKAFIGDSEMDNLPLDIYNNITKEYTLEQLERAERTYDYQVYDSYDIKEIDYYE